MIWKISLIIVALIAVGIANSSAKKERATISHILRQLDQAPGYLQPENVDEIVDDMLGSRYYYYDDDDDDDRADAEIYIPKPKLRPNAVSEFEPAIMTLAYNVLKRILGNMRFGALRGFLKTPDTLMAKLKAKGRFVGAIADMMGVENVVIIIKAHIIGPKEAIFIKECDASWTSAGRGPRGVLNCDDFASRKYCTASGEKGDGWKGYYGSYNHRLGWWTDEAGRTCLVCPQCGCGKTAM